MTGADDAPRDVSGTGDLYEELGVGAEARADEILRALRRLAKDHHPDANSHGRRLAARGPYRRRHLVADQRRTVSTRVGRPIAYANSRFGCRCRCARPLSPSRHPVALVNLALDHQYIAHRDDDVRAALHPRNLQGDLDVALQGQTTVVTELREHRREQCDTEA